VLACLLPGLDDNQTTSWFQRAQELRPIATQCCTTDTDVCHRMWNRDRGPSNDEQDCISGVSRAGVLPLTTYEQAVATCVGLGLGLCNSSCFNYGCNYNANPVFSQLPCPQPPRVPPLLPPSASNAPPQCPLFTSPPRAPVLPLSPQSDPPRAPIPSEEPADDDDPAMRDLPAWTVITLAASGVVIVLSCCAVLLLCSRRQLCPDEGPISCACQFLVLIKLLVALACTVIAMKAAQCWFAACARKRPSLQQAESSEPASGSNSPRNSSGRGGLSSRGASLSSRAESLRTRRDSLLDRLQSLRITIREDQLKRASDLSLIRTSTIAEGPNEAEAALELAKHSCNCEDSVSSNSNRPPSRLSAQL